MPDFGYIPFTPFMPHLQRTDGSAVPLAECDEKQCEELRQQLLTKFQMSVRMGKPHLCRQLDAMVRTVDERLEVLENIRARTPVKKVDPFEKMKISDD